MISHPFDLTQVERCCTGWISIQAKDVGGNLRYAGKLTLGLLDVLRTSRLGDSVRSRERRLTTTSRAFRISWAIEAAKRPVTASFSASMSAFWICLRSVRSTTVPMKRIPYLISVALFEERSPLTAEPANNVWGLDSSSNVYRFNNQAQNWTQIVGTLKQISAGANGSVWGLTVPTTFISLSNRSSQPTRGMQSPARC